MKSLTLVLVTTLFGAMASATLADPRNETQTMECGVLRDHGTASRSAPYVTVVSVKKNGTEQNYVKMQSLTGSQYEILVQRSVNHGASVQESKSYRLLIVLKPRKITITSKVNSAYTAVCKNSYRL